MAPNTPGSISPVQQRNDQRHARVAAQREQQQVAFSGQAGRGRVSDLSRRQSLTAMLNRQTYNTQRCQVDHDTEQAMYALKRKAERTRCQVRQRDGKRDA